MVLPNYIETLANNLRSIDWKIPPKEIMDIANAEALADRTKKNGPFSAASLYQKLQYYAEIIRPERILFFHRDVKVEEGQDEEEGRKHWLLFEVVGQAPICCFDPMSQYEDIENPRRVMKDMHTIATYLFGEESPDCPMNKDYYGIPLGVQRDGSSCGFWSATFCLLKVCGIDIESAETCAMLDKLKIETVKKHLAEIWTSWCIGEEGLEEEALNSFLRHFKAERDGLSNSCVASRPPWIARAEDPPNDIMTNQFTVPTTHDDQPSESESAENLKKHQEEAELAADEFCDKLSRDRLKVLGRTGPLFLDHMSRISSLDGWLPGDVISEWAKYVDAEASLPDTKVLETAFFNQIRKHSHDLNTDRTSLEKFWKRFVKGTCKWFKMYQTRAIILPIHVPSHWICAFVDFDKKYLTIFDSWKRNTVPGNVTWDKSVHSQIFKLIKEWLNRLFLSLQEIIDWDEWDIDPNPKGQPYQVNGHDCGPHTCLAMILLANRQINDIHRLNEVIDAPAIRKFRYVMFARFMQCGTGPISKGEIENCGNDSDRVLLDDSDEPDEGSDDEEASRPVTPVPVEQSPRSKSEDAGVETASDSRPTTTVVQSPRDIQSPHDKSVEIESRM
ncbi:hypothetical protein C8R45DRAFT_1091191 [Mycena sanguinolenta]|nr:hypothetical protein C8R45DRAFT_1091191 [Mycena sanguinolenta]